MKHAAPNTERGAALLSTLIIVALMSVAALVALDALARAVSLSKVGQARTEAVWVSQSAEMVGASLLADTIRLTNGRISESTPGLGEPQLFQTQHGMLTAVLSDASNCFNLNALARPATGDGLQIDRVMLERYRRLLRELEFTAIEARRLADGLADWMDADTLARSDGAEADYYEALEWPYRPSGQMLESLNELAAIAGYTQENIERLKGHICTRPNQEQSVLNLNTLGAEQYPLLIALFGPSLDPDTARRLIEERPAQGWSSVNEFLAQPSLGALEGQVFGTEYVSVVSRYFALSADINIAATRSHLDVLYYVAPAGEVRTLWRRRGSG